MQCICALSLAGFLLGGAASGQDTPKPMKVFILAGQSNIVGVAPSKDLPEEYRKPPSNVRIFKARKWQSVEATEATFGPEISFAHAISEAWPAEEVGIIKVAFNGSSLLDWDPDWTEEKAAITKKKGGPLYKKFIEAFERARKDRPFEVVGMLWGQGGRDARFKEAAEQRAANLERFIVRLRQDLKVPDLPFLYPRSSKVYSEYPYMDAVRKGNEEVARKLAGVTLFDGDGLSYLKDDVHLDAAGQVEYGRRFARAFLDLKR